MQETAKTKATAMQAERRVTELESAAQASAQTLAQRQREHREELHALRTALGRVSRSGPVSRK